MPLTAGSKLGPYQILKLIGSGGMGEVYRALDTRLDRDVAIKILPTHLSGDSIALKRFQRETKAVAALSHPNILEIHDVGTENGISFAVMELLEGETLRSRMNRQPLSWEKTLEIAIPITEGLGAAHAKGIIHRDLKPENIFLTSDGRVKILDFGLARVQNPQDAELSVAVTRSLPTSDHGVAGTIPYMSPEQVRGSPLDVRTDIFSFGSILYEMLTGYRAFNANSAADIISAILNQDPAPLQKDIPTELKLIIERCLKKNRDERVQSAKDLSFGLKMIGFEPPKIVSQSSKVKRNTLWLVPLMIVAAIILIGFRFQMRTRSSSPEIRSIAVLPLKNFSADSNQEFFADGMTEELIATLAKIESLRVISRTSVMEYKDSHKSLPEIAKELHVDAVLEGSVMRSGNKVRITTQLIHGTTDQHLWAESYERELNDIFFLQSEVASNIATEIKIKLTPTEKRNLSSATKVNPAAYDAYLRGFDYLSRPCCVEENIKLGERLLQRAVELDPNFALAYAYLGHAHAYLYHAGIDVTNERIAKAKAAIDRAFELHPGIPEGHKTLGYYFYFCFRDYEKALKEFAIAKKDIPNDWYIYNGTGVVYRRQGNFDAAIGEWKKAFELAPRDPNIVIELANTYSSAGYFEEADHYFNLAISVGPDAEISYALTAWNYIDWKGSTELARAMLEKMPTTKEPNSIDFWLNLEICERKYDDALKRLFLESNNYAWSEAERTERAGIIFRFKNDLQKSHSYFEKSRILYEKEVNQTNSRRSRSRLAVILAGLGRREEAIRQGKFAVEILPVHKDSQTASFCVQQLARVYTMLGEYDLAIDQLELLNSDGFVRIASPANIRIDPWYDPLHNHPRFQKMIQKGI